MNERNEATAGPRPGVNGQPIWQVLRIWESPDEKEWALWLQCGHTVYTKRETEQKPDITESSCPLCPKVPS